MDADQVQRHRAMDFVPGLAALEQRAQALPAFDHQCTSLRRFFKLAADDPGVAGEFFGESFGVEPALVVPKRLGAVGLLD